MRFSSVFCSVAVLALAGCAFFIPDNPSAPRYSTLQGERHVPALNQGLAQGGAPAQAATSQPAPVAEVAANDLPPAAAAPADNPAFPPVSAETRTRANEVIAARQVPVENGAVQLAGNAPAFTDVPPRPPMSGDASAETQLNQVRAQLERDRAAAEAAHGQLATDAAAEPSLLKDAAPSTMPPAAPVVPLAPLGNPPPAAVPLSPPPAPTSNNFIAPVPLMPPPPPPTGGAITFNQGNPANAAPAIDVTPAPQVAGLEPIVLRPPVGFTPAAAAPRPVAVAPPEYAPSGASPVGGGFNPNASGDSARSFASGTGYLPASRYTR